MTERVWIIRDHYVQLRCIPNETGFDVTVDGEHVGRVADVGRRVEAIKLARTHLERTVPGANPWPEPYADGTVYQP